MTRISNETSKIFKDPSYISKKLSDLKKKKKLRGSLSNTRISAPPLYASTHGHWNNGASFEPRVNQHKGVGRVAIIWRRDVSR